MTAIETHLEITVVAREQRRGAPADADQPRPRPPRTGSDQLRRGRAAPHGGRPGPPGVRQAVPGDGMASAPRRRLAVPPPAARRGTEADLGRPRRRGRRRHRRATMEYETDRARFLGAARTPADPGAPGPRRALSGTTGPVLDPVFSLRRRVRLAPASRCRVAFSHRRGRHAARRPWPWPISTTTASARHARLRAGLGTQPGRAAPPASVAPRKRICTSAWPAHLIYAGPALRRPRRAGRQSPGPAGPVAATAFPATGPSCSSASAERRRLPLVRQLLPRPRLLATARGWRSIWSILERAADQLLRRTVSAVQDLVARQRSPRPDRQAGRRLRAQGGRSCRRGPDAAAAAARVVLGGATAARWRPRSTRRSRPPPLRPIAARAGEPTRAEPTRLGPQRLFATAGRFTRTAANVRQRPRRLHAPMAANTSSRPTGTRLEPACPPAPWINVVANPACGFLVSESGSATPGPATASEPPDAVEQRSGLRSARRGASICATRRPATSGRRRRCRSATDAADSGAARPGLHRFEQRSHGLDAGADACSCRPTTRSR